ncbi:hypothetical protein TRL7639_04493 [Falsiruegeria litorea R37]|uniref:Capsule polysaccharide biosynthesis protein n=1 Tax=Falsiruegeria litorea R37 TaxID=1200284 RepID=A0A1Y5TVD8_9RHOB|nr:hypothetical protein [Falsiruegeria litorea]SLN74102.1 hypothetical protein TRL7639_04493 [Falsiruegeria litorea R37]
MSHSITARPANVPEPGTVDVLFVTYGGGHCRMVIPVAQELEARGIKTCVFALTLAIPPVRDSGLDWFGYSNLPQAQDPHVQSMGKELSKGFPTDGPVAIEETVAYMGLNYRDLELTHGAEAAEALYAESGRFKFHPYHIMLETLELIRPKVVVATNSPRSERAAIEAASHLDIPALCMIDMFAIQEKEWIKEPGYGTKVSVLNEWVRDMLIENGRPAGDIHITGNPAFDQLQTDEVRAKGQALRTDRGWGQEGRTTLLYASAPESPTDPYTGEPADMELPLKVENELKAIVAANEELELVIRRHPSEDQTVALAPRVHQSTMADDIDVLLHAVDIVAVTCSTVGFQGYLAGRDVLSVECSVVSRDAPYGAFGISRAAMTIGDIDAVLRDILETPGDAKDTRRSPAGQEISDLIEQLLPQQRQA